MKKTLTVFLCFLVLAAALPAASADVIWVPDSPFFSAHESECVRVDRIFEAAKDTRYYTQPDGKARSDIPAGTVLRVAFTWQDRWGSVDWSDDWVDLADFRRLNDARDFALARGSEFLGVSGELLLYPDGIRIVWNGDDALESLRAKAGELPETGAYDAVLWDYPGSDRITRTLDAGISEENPAYGPDFTNAWTDGEGRLWLYFSTYFCGDLDGWLCLPEMNSTEPPFVTERYADAGAAADGGEEGKDGSAAGATAADGPRSGGGRPPLLPIAAVLLVTAVTAVLLAVLRQKKTGER